MMLFLIPADFADIIIISTVVFFLVLMWACGLPPTPQDEHMKRG